MAIDIHELRGYLLTRPGACEETPFGPQTLVYKVLGRLFALVAWQDTPLRLTLRCDPDHALILRSMFPAVQPGYYMNKRLWNTVTLDGSLCNDDIYEMIDDSYSLALQGLSPYERVRLEAGIDAGHRPRASHDL